MNDGDPEVSQSLTFNVTAGTASGNISFDIAPSIDESTGDLTYTLTENSNGTANFFVTLVDNGTPSATSIQRNFVIEVISINDPPTLANIPNPSPINEDAGQQTIALSDITAGGGENQTITVTASSGNEALINNITLNYTSPGNSGTLNYTPITNAHGTAVITVRVSDGVDEITKSFTVTVNPIADTPGVTNASANEGSQNMDGLVITRNTNDGAEVTHFKITSITNGTLFLNNGTTAISNGGFITVGQGTAGLKFTPNSPLDGSFVVQASTNNNDSGLGGGLAQATIFVNGLPTSVGIDDIVVDEDAPNFTIDLDDIFDDPEDADSELTFTIQTNSNGSIFDNVSINNMVLTINPASNANGFSNFVIRCTDTDGAFVNEAFRFTITPVNDAPAFNLSQNSITANENFNGNIMVDVNEAAVPSDESGQDVIYSLSPTNVSFVNISINSNTGRITLNSVANQSGSQTFQVIANDGQSANNTFTRLLTVTVGAVNNPPVFTLSGNVNELEDFTETLTVTVTPGVVPDDEQDQEVNYSISPTSVNFADISFDNSTGNVLINSVPDRFGARTFTITANDGQSENNTFSEQFTLTIINVDDNPTMDDIDDISLPEGAGEQQITLTGLSAGPFESQQISNIIATSFNPTNIPNPVVVYNAPQTQGTLVFTPNPDAAGQTTIQIFIVDTGGKTLTKTFTVSIDDQNDAPSFNPIASPLTINEDAGEQILNITGITAGPGENQTLSFTVVSDNTDVVDNPIIDYISPSSIGTLTFTAKPDSNGTATLTITLMDNGPSGGSNENTYSQNVVVNVSPINDPPSIISTPVVNAISETEYVYNITATDPDEGDILSFVDASIPDWLTLVDNNDGTAVLSGTPSSDDLGSHTVQIDVEDQNGASSGQPFTIEVLSENNLPEFVSTPVEDAFEKVFYEYDIEVDDADGGDIIIIEAIDIPTWLLFTDNGNRTARLEGTPPDGSEGEYEILLRATDSRGDEVEQSFTITVAPFNAIPRLRNIQQTTEEDEPIAYTSDLFNTNFIDDDGDVIAHIIITTLPENGRLELNGEAVSIDDMINSEDIENLQYIPNENFNGFDSFNWNAFDGTAYADNDAIITITITPEPDAPQLVNLEGDNLYYEFGRDSIIVTNTIQVIEVDNGRIERATVTISENYMPGVDSLTAIGIGNVEVAFNTTTGTLQLSGIDSSDTYEEVLRSVVYYFKGGQPNASMPRSISFQVRDAEQLSNIANRVINFQDRFVELDIPNGFTPNDDADNDTWNIINIELYPDVIVQVYARNGAKVFESRGYTNEWDGYSSDGQELPPGIYYYFINLNKFDATYKGSITILR